MDYLWKKVGEGWGGDPEDTNGRRASWGPGLGEREGEREKRERERNERETQVIHGRRGCGPAQFIFIRDYFQSDLNMQWLCEFAATNPDIHLRLSRGFMVYSLCCYPESRGLVWFDCIYLIGVFKKMEQWKTWRIF